MNVCNDNKTQVSPMETYYIPNDLFRLPMCSPFPSDKAALSAHPSLLVITSGSIRLRINGSEQTITGCSAIGYDKDTSFQLIGMERLQGIFIEYRSLTFNDSPPLPLPFCKAPIPCSHSISELASELDLAWQTKNERPFQAHRLFLTLLEGLQKELEETKLEHNDWLQQTLDYIHLHYREELTREKLAASVGISPEHFSRVFHKQTGCTFTSYLNTLRIRDVQQRLLTGTTSNLHDLALEVGYKDGYYLSRKFKQLVGSAPMIFIRKPKRIVSANFNYTAMLLALKVEPVLGAYSTWIRTSRAGLPDNQTEELFGKRGGIAYEQVQALKPDVIIGYEQLTQDKQLMRIAPVVGLPFMQLDWREQFRQLAEIVGQEQRAIRILDNYDRQVETANQLLDRKLGKNNRGSLMIWELHANKAYVFGNRFGRGGHVLYDDLGFHLPEQLAQGPLHTKGYINMPLEQLHASSTDMIIITDDQPSLTGPSSLLQPNKRSTLSRQRRIMIPNQADLFYGFDPLSTQKQLEVLLSSLIS